MMEGDGMTAQERIEGLLNKAGQTIDDLPFFYKDEARETAKQAVRQRMRSGWFVSRNDYLDFICHLTDVIDRMEWALDKTLQKIPAPKQELPFTDLPDDSEEEMAQSIIDDPVPASRLGEMHTGIDEEEETE